MSHTTTRPDDRRTDEYGIERVHEDEPGFVDRYREKFHWFDHVMRMQERFASRGGNQYSAGITYFSVLSVFPLAMLLFAAAGFVLANDPVALGRIQDTISNTLEGEIGEMVNGIVDTAVAQRGAVLGIGGLTAIWSGLNWMNHLRFGASRMWDVDATEGNFVVKKLLDLVGLVVLILALIAAFGIAIVGSSSLMVSILERIGLDEIPGISAIVWVGTVVVGLIANFLVFFWLMLFLPRTKVPRKSALQGAVLGAVIFEVVKQLGSLVTTSAVSSPAGAAFGPIIGLMIVLYLVWRILMYCCAWAATTDEALSLADVPTPPPAIINVRQEINPAAEPAGVARNVGIGVAVGAAATAVFSLLRKR